MTVQRIAQLFGIVFILVAILGFVTTGTSMTADMDHAARLLGLFPVNALHNAVHLLFGILGLAAGMSFGSARAYCSIGGAIYLVLAIVGFITPTTFGLIPIGGHDIWLHAVLGVALIAAGTVVRAPIAAPRTA